MLYFVHRTSSSKDKLFASVAVFLDEAKRDEYVAQGFDSTNRFRLTLTAIDHDTVLELMGRIPGAYLDESNLRSLNFSASGFVKLHYYLSAIPIYLFSYGQIPLTK